MTILEHRSTSRDLSPEEIGQAKAMLGEAVQALRKTNRDLDHLQVVRITAAELEAADALPDPDGWLEALGWEREASHRRFLRTSADCLRRMARNHRGRLAGYAEIGRVATVALTWQYNDGVGWTGLNYLRHVLRMEEGLRRRSGVRNTDVERCLKLRAWVEAVRPMVPGVERMKLSQVVARFLPLMDWNPVEFEGAIRPGWREFVREAVARQVSDDPMTDEELADAIADRKAELAAPRRDVMRLIDQPSRGHRYASPELARPRA